MIKVKKAKTYRQQRSLQITGTLPSKPHFGFHKEILFFGPQDFGYEIEDICFQFISSTSKYPIHMGLGELNISTYIKFFIGIEEFSLKEFKCLLFDPSIEIKGGKDVGLWVANGMKWFKVGDLQFNQTIEVKKYD